MRSVTRERFGTPCRQGELDVSVRWISPEEAADRTPLSRKAIYGAIRRGELRAAKRCGRWMISEADLEAWIGAGTAEPAESSVRMMPRQRRLGQVPAHAGSLAALRSIEAEARR